MTNPCPPIPVKIQQRLADLLTMGEFDEAEVNWCRSTYWGARDDWHRILVACFDAALIRSARGEKVASSIA